MAGQHGNERSTMRNLKLVRIDAENNLLLVRGAVPGPNGGYVIIQRNEQDVVEQLQVAVCSSESGIERASHGQLDRLQPHAASEVGKYEIEPDRSGAAHQQAVAARRGGDVPVESAAGHGQDQEPRRGGRHDQEDVSPEGTGNARAGSRRSGIRRGGGHIFAKRPRDWTYRLPRKAVQLATRMALASKIRDDASRR